MDQMPPALSDQALMGQLRATLVEVLGRYLRPGTRVALLDFPGHTNVGDSAIWLGELELLHALGARLVYAGDITRYDPGVVRRRVGSGGLVLLHGGGNLGDLWPRHQAFRERVLVDLVDLPVIQLPQSIHFREPGAVTRAREIMMAHRSFTLLARDRPSLEFAERELGVRTTLCPDSAFMLQLRRPVTARQPVLWLSRTDHEAAESGSGESSGLAPVDWLREPRGRLASVSGALDRWHARPSAPATSVRVWYRLQAGRRLRRGCRLLARGRVVVTNRLHAQILSLLMGIPHFFTDTAQGKLTAHYRTWLEASLPGIGCRSVREALERASALAARMASGQQEAR